MPRNDIVHPRDRPVGKGIFVGLEHVESGTGHRVGSVQIDLAGLSGRKARFRAGDIVYGYLRPYLNKVWVADFDGYCSVDQYVFAVAPSVDANYVAAYLRSPEFLHLAPVNGSPGQLPRIRTNEVLSVPIPLPAISEQRRIVTRLAHQFAAVDVARAAALESRNAANVLRLRAYDLAFCGVTPLAVGRGEGPPDGWAWHFLTDLARLESGHTPSRGRPDWWGGNVPWIALPDIRSVDGLVATDTGESTNLEGIAHSSARVLPENTVVMSRTASVGYVTRMGRPMATSQDFVNWVCGPMLDPEFLMQLLIRSRSYIRSLSSGAVHKTVYFPTVKAFRVCVPPTSKQMLIATELRERIAAISSIEKVLVAEAEAIDVLRPMLLRRAFAKYKAA